MGPRAQESSAGLGALLTFVDDRGREAAPAAGRGRGKLRFVVLPLLFAYCNFLFS